MGTSRRPRPARLASKLQQIRARLGLTQAEMFERLGDTGTRLYVGHIDDYEKDRRVPTLQVVLGNFISFLQLDEAFSIMGDDLSRKSVPLKQVHSRNIHLDCGRCNYRAARGV